MDELSCIGEAVLGVVECLLVFDGPLKMCAFLLASEKVRERCADAGDVRHQGMIEVVHAEEMAEIFDGSRCRHFPHGEDFFWQRLDAVAVHMMAEEIDGVDAEDALRLLDDEAVICEVLEESAKVLLCSASFFAGDQNVVKKPGFYWFFSNFWFSFQPW